MPLNTPQHKNIYCSGELYDDIHWWKKNDLEFWTTMFLQTNPTSVLEIACGTGRLAKIFLRERVSYAGLDIMPNFIKVAENKFINYCNNYSFIEADMRNFKLNKKFDLVFIGFNSFLHLITDDDIINCLNCVKNHMHANSHFIIDVYIPNPLFLYRPKGHKMRVLEFMCSKTNERNYVEETSSYDSLTDINELTWFFSTDKKPNYETRRFSLRMLFPSKMNHMLTDAGFRICNQWGDYQQTKLNESSKLQIYDLMLLA